MLATSHQTTPGWDGRGSQRARSQELTHNLACHFVLLPDLLGREGRSVTAVDLSPSSQELLVLWLAALDGKAELV